jgi:NADPH-dependent curcumin reductase CurA
MSTKQIILASRPKGIPTTTDFRFENIELLELKEGEVLLEGMYYSVDPYMRGRMNEAKSYVAPFQVGEPLDGGVIAKVLKSTSPDFIAGDVIQGMLPWRNQMVVPAKMVRKINAESASPSFYLGVLGMPGLAAYFGLMDIGKPTSGETVVVSGAAGAVGVLVGQIAKLQGCRVIGIAGSDEKTKLLTHEFGFDEAINYKTTTDLKKVIAGLCPKGVDIYFDNVGGAISDAVISNINFNARIPLCGQISMYNSSEVPTGPRIQPMLITRSVLMKGFIVSNYQNRFPEGILKLTQWVKEGKLKFPETIVNGFDQLPTALLGLFKGENVGKMLVKA